MTRRGQRRVEEEHDAVADELVPRALIGTDDREHPAHVFVDGRDDALLELFRQRGEALDVGKDNAELAVLASEVRELGVFEVVVDDAWIDLRSESTDDARLFLG